MKKIFLFAFAAAAVLSGCSKDETIEVSRPGAITFDSFVNLSTKAEDVTTGNLGSFKVWGLMTKDGTAHYNVFDEEGKVVESNDNGSTWTYSPTAYWEDGYRYSFVAVAPTNSNAWSLEAPKAVGEWGKITFTNDGDTDLVYDADGTYASSAINTNDDTVCPAPISFTFNHLLSRVKFKFTNAMADNSVLEISDVTITNANNKAVATLDVDEAKTAWTLADDNTETALEFGDVSVKVDEENDDADFDNGITRETAHKYMIPKLSDSQVYNLEFRIKRTTSAGLVHEYDHSVDLPAEVVWASGNSYCFTSTIDHTNVDPDKQLCPIVFTADVDPWEDYNETKLPDYTIDDNGQ